MRVLLLKAHIPGYSKRDGSFVRPHEDKRPTAAPVVGRLGRHPRRPDHLSLFHSNGELSNTFAHDQSRDDIAAILAKHGFELREDDTVVKRDAAAAD